jgi:hypothetical protein
LIGREVFGADTIVVIDPSMNRDSHIHHMESTGAYDKAFDSPNFDFKRRKDHFMETSDQRGAYSPRIPTVLGQKFVRTHFLKTTPLISNFEIEATTR